MARTNSSGSVVWTEIHFSRSSPRTTSTAIALAISPAAAPPMPSATMNSVPFGPSVCRRTSGWSVGLFVDRSATTNASSLCSRVRPTSVRPKTLTITSPCGSEPRSLIARREGLLTDTIGSVAHGHRAFHLARPRRSGRDRSNAAQRGARRRVVVATALGERVHDRGLHQLLVSLDATLHLLHCADDARRLVRRDVSTDDLLQRIERRADGR